MKDSDKLSAKSCVRLFKDNLMSENLSSKETAILHDRIKSLEYQNIANLERLEQHVAQEEKQTIKLKELQQKEKCQKINLNRLEEMERYLKKVRNKIKN